MDEQIKYQDPLEVVDQMEGKDEIFEIPVKVFRCSGEEWEEILKSHEENGVWPEDEKSPTRGD